MVMAATAFNLNNGQQVGGEVNILWELSYYWMNECAFSNCFCSHPMDKCIEECMNDAKINGWWKARWNGWRWMFQCMDGWIDRGMDGLTSPNKGLWVRDAGETAAWKTFLDSLWQIRKITHKPTDTHSVAQLMEASAAHSLLVEGAQPPWETMVNTIQISLFT